MFWYYNDRSSFNIYHTCTCIFDHPMYRLYLHYNEETGYPIDGAMGSSGGGRVRKLSVVCLHNNAIVARGILVTILHCGTSEPRLSATPIVSSVGTSFRSTRDPLLWGLLYMFMVINMAPDYSGRCSMCRIRLCNIRFVMLIAQFTYYVLVILLYRWIVFSSRIVISFTSKTVSNICFLWFFE